MLQATQHDFTLTTRRYLVNTGKYNICQSRKLSGSGNPPLGCVKSLASVTSSENSMSLSSKKQTYNMSTFFQLVADMRKAYLQNVNAVASVTSPENYAVSKLMGKSCCIDGENYAVSRLMGKIIFPTKKAPERCSRTGRTA